jgi:hypothetical protein
VATLDTLYTITTGGFKTLIIVNGRRIKHPDQGMRPERERESEKII